MSRLISLSVLNYKKCSNGSLAAYFHSLLSSSVSPSFWLLLCLLPSVLLQPECATAAMSQFVDFPIKALKLEHPLQYDESALAAAKSRNSLVSSSLVDKLQNKLSFLKLNPQFIENMNIPDLMAKVYNFGVEYKPTEEQDQLWLFTSTLAVFLYEFDDYFDKQSNTPESVSKVSMEMRSTLRALSRHGLSGLQGNFDDWPTTVPFREAYCWLLREADDLRAGAAELLHYTFFDYCLGVEMEIAEWAPDVYQNDMSSWNLDRCNEVRKRSIGLALTLVPPLYIACKWTKKEDFTTCSDLMYEAGIILGLANDIYGFKKDQRELDEKNTISMLTIMVVNPVEIAQAHNEKVEYLKERIMSLDGDARRLMEEVERSVVGIVVWQSNCKRYQ